MDRFVIRPGIESDHEDVKRIAKECNFLSWSKGSVRSWAKTPGSVFLVAEIDGRIVGFILSRTVLDEAEILVLAINEKYRNKGIGTLLLLRNLQFLGDQKIRRIFLEVDVANEMARHLYEKVGFKVDGVRKKYYDGKRDAYIMSYN